MPVKNSITKAYVLTTVPQKLEPRDALRLGLIIQNQSGNGAAKIYVGSCGNVNVFATIELAASSNVYEDLITPQDEVWAFSDVNGTTLSLTLRY
jgi:hypothetical protein